MQPTVIDCTLLTRMDKTDLADVGIASDLRSEVVRLAGLAQDSGLDGIVASPHEIRLIRECITAERFIILTPGIRPAWSEKRETLRGNTFAYQANLDRKSTRLNSSH